MRYESIQGIQIPKIGMGTWQIGGQNQADASLDERSMAALRSALELGYTHFDTAEVYAAGHAEELLGRAIHETGVDRATLFITSKVSPFHLKYEDVLSSCRQSLQRLGMDYLDLYLIHWPAINMKLDETFQALNLLVREGRVRHLGVSNFNKKLMEKSAALSESPLLTNQVSYSVPDRTYAENGVLDHCQKNGILLTAYSPVKRRNIKGNKNLQSIALTRGVSPQQVALAWLCTQPRVITIPMSFDPAHQADNLAAAELVLSPAEMELIG